jgi:hypothetical protein
MEHTIAPDVAADLESRTNKLLEGGLFAERNKY